MSNRVVKTFEQFSKELPIDINGDLVEPGDRIRLVEPMIEDHDQIQVDDEGVVDHIDSMNQLHVIWDSGRKLALIPGIDVFEII